MLYILSCMKNKDEETKYNCKTERFAEENDNKYFCFASKTFVLRHK